MRRKSNHSHSTMYPQVFELQANLIKTLAHSKRLEIIHLIEQEPMCVSDICQRLHTPQANISQHLMVLRNAKVVKAQRSGKQIFYTLSSLKVTQAIRLLPK